MIKRIHSYDDKRFSKKVLQQHGAFEVDGLLYEVEIISNDEAIVKGSDKYILEVIEEFRFYAEHITKFYNEENICIMEYPKINLFEIELTKIQPSQFYVDEDKKKQVSNFIYKPEDILIPVMKHNNRFISLDGHTRMSVAIDRGYHSVYGFITEAEDYINDFVKEAVRRNINSPFDMKVISHQEYDILWNQFCSEYFDY